MEREPKSKDKTGLLPFRGLLRALGRDETPAFRPIGEHYSPTLGVYQGPSGPIATLARVSQNVREGRSASEGLPPDPLNDPNSP